MSPPFTPYLLNSLDWSNVLMITSSTLNLGFVRPRSQTFWTVIREGIPPFTLVLGFMIRHYEIVLRHIYH